MENKKVENFETTGQNFAEEMPPVFSKWKCDIRGVLSFTMTLLFIGALVTAALGMMLLSKSNSTYLAVTWLSLGIVQFFAGTSLIFVLQKIPSLPQEDRERLKKPTQICKRAAVGIEILLCLLPFIFLGIQDISHTQPYADNLQASTFGAYADEIHYITYTFENGNTCVRREYDVSGYTPVVLAEESLKYSVIGSTNACEIKINNVRYKTDISSQAIWRFKVDGNTFNKLEEKDVPVVPYTSFVSSYNSAVLGSGSNILNSNASDSDYISAAKSALNRHGAIKYPETAVWYSSQVYEKDCYGRAIVYLDFSCENAFGVAQRYQRYVFIQEINGDQYSVYKNFYHCDQELLDFYKAMNKFGEHPNQDEYVSILAEEAQPLNSVAKITPENILVRYICNTPLVTIELYADSVTNNLSAVKVTVISGKYTNEDTENRELIMKATKSAMAQIEGAQKAELVNTGSYAFTAESLTNYLITNEKITDFVKGGLIISADVVDGKSVVTVVDGFRYGFTEENYWTPLGKANTDSLLCSQCGADCTSIGLETDGRCTDCHAGNSTSAPGGLFGTLDFSKVWETEWTEAGSTFSALYAFEENGTCYMVMSWVVEALGGGKGTYTINGNSITISLVLDGSYSVSYTYTFDSENRTFTQTSETGLTDSHKQGDSFQLKENSYNTIDRIKSLAQSFSNRTDSSDDLTSGDVIPAGNFSSSSSSSSSDSSSSSGGSGGYGNASSDTCSHTYVAATCTAPETCTKCGATKGYTADHDWKPVSCTSYYACSACGQQLIGATPGHSWEKVTETAHHKEQGHYEDVKVSKKVQKYRCPMCGYSASTYSTLDAYYSHFDSTHGADANSSFNRDRYEIVEEWEYTYETQWVVDKEAYTETIITGYKCSVCGKKQATPD